MTKRGPDVEARTVAYRLGDAERNGDAVGEQCHPEAERDRDRQLFLDQVDHRDGPEIALPEVEAGVIPQHQPEAFERWLVEAEFLLELLDEFRIEPLGATIFGRDGLARHLVGCLSADVGTGAGEPIGLRRYRCLAAWRSPSPTGPPGANCTTAKLMAMMPMSVGIIRRRRRRR